MLLCHLSRIGCELIERGVEPIRKNPFDVIAVALDRFFAAVLPDQMRIEVTLPSLLEGDARDGSAVCHCRSGMRSFALLLVLWVPYPANLGQVFLGGGAQLGLTSG